MAPQTVPDQKVIMAIKVLLTGATGMVGEGVLHECLNHPDVSSVLVLGRRPCGVTHPKIREIVHGDLFDLTPIQDELTGYQACFFCLGVSSMGKTEEEFRRLTHTLTLHVGEVLSRRNPGMAFCYISGAGTDSSEKGKVMWARVKGKTENDLRELPFKAVYAFRPGMLKPTKGLKNALKLYAYFGWVYPILRWLAPSTACTLSELGLAMIHAVTRESPKATVEVSDIVDLAKP